MRMWDKNDVKELNQFTESFDSCGAKDGTGDANIIDKGSKHPEWLTALNFLEWFGLQRMDGFGVIIIDK